MTMPVNAGLKKAEYLLGILDMCIKEDLVGTAQGPLRVGVDLGTTCVVTVVIDENQMPIAAEMTKAKVVREGVVINYLGGVNVVQEHIALLNNKLGQKISIAATAVPPGTGSSVIL